MEQVKGYCSDSRDEEEEEEGADDIIAITGGGEESSSSSRLQLQQTSQQEEEEEEEKDAGVGKLNEEEVDLMELRLGGGGSKSKGSDEGLGIGCSSNSKDEEEAVAVAVVVEKEHMFDKVVTPSDVGKLNRLVIPKQHAEKYFPLDSSTNEKGLLLNFEDRNGKMWRFRYSYWNSSQSYVMTKGWSRFVKEKKLDAGDIVSFHRGRAELYRHRLYIDWRPRAHSQYSYHHHHHLIPQYPPPPPLPFYLPPNHHYSSYAATSRPLYTSPQYSHLPNPNTNYVSPSTIPHPQYYNSNFYTTTTTTLHHQQQQQQQYHHPSAAADHLVNNNNMNPLYYLTSSPITPPSTTTTGGGGGGDQHLQGPVVQGHQQDQRNLNVPMNMIIDSVPVAHHHRVGNVNTSGKRLRLFGVNMECDSSSPPPPPPQPTPTSVDHDHHHRGGTSLHFDLDPSNSQYRRNH